MLGEVTQENVDYVLVLKLDRLTRDRVDVVAILAVIQAAGPVLVSATEQIDEIPPGMLMHGIAPIGYVNTNTQVEGRDIRGVAIDHERAELIRWAFRTYATGDLSISTLRDELEERGLHGRKTATYVGTPLTISQVHLMLSNPYYIGTAKHREAFYGGICTS